MMSQGAIAKFDPRGEQFTYFKLPPEANNDMAQISMVSAESSLDQRLLTRAARNTRVSAPDTAGAVQ
jgi:hypothetical protein